MSPTPVSLNSAFSKAESLIEVENEQAKHRRSAKAQAIIVGVLVHVILGFIATLAVVAHNKRDAPIIQVMAAPQTESSNPDNPTLKKTRVTDTRNTAALAPDTFTVPNIASISIPDVDDSFAEPDLGFGTSDLGLGFGASVENGAGSFFAVEETVKSVVLVIDTSSSMPKECGANGIAAIRAEIKRVLDGLISTASFNIVCYGNDADRFAKRLVPATPENRNAAHKFMAGYFGAGPWLRTRVGEYGDRKKDPEGIAYFPVVANDFRDLRSTSGGSRIELGLLAAFEMKPETIFVLSDGAPNVKRAKEPLSHGDLLNLIDKAADKTYGRSDGAVQVNTVSINGLGEKFLKNVAKTFSGTHRDIRPKSL